MHPVGERPPYDAMVERMRDLNPDVSVGIASEDTGRCDLMLALIGGAPTAEAGRASGMRFARERGRAAPLSSRGSIRRGESR